MTHWRWPRAVPGGVPVWKLNLTNIQLVAYLPEGGPPSPFLSSHAKDILMFNLSARPGGRAPIHVNADFDEVVHYVRGPGAWGHCTEPGTLTWVPKGVVHHGPREDVPEGYAAWLAGNTRHAAMDPRGDCQLRADGNGKLRSASERHPGRTDKSTSNTRLRIASCSKNCPLWEAAKREMEDYQFAVEAAIQPKWNVPRKIAINAAVSSRFGDGKQSKPMSLEDYVDAASSVIEAGACGVHIDFSWITDDKGRRLDRDVPPVEAYSAVLEPLRNRFGQRLCRKPKRTSRFDLRHLHEPSAWRIG